ncbi:hypothetical protein EXS57_02425 [Candidatus Kaiserbacteria bacterium]|nr:hypothetical protein [Candidatus Kaiserbacteria bacterium]
MRYKFLVAVTSVILVAGVSIGFIYPHRSAQKCPDDYANDDAGEAAYLVAMDKWTNDFYDEHPEASLSDWSAARHQFWIDNHCTAALQRYDEAVAGNADLATMRAIQDDVWEVVDASPEAQKAAAERIVGLKCPEDYKTQDEKVHAFLDFLNDYVTANPKAKGDIAVIDAGRTDFLITRHCTSTLMNFGYDGVSPIDARVRQELITTMIDNDTGSSTKSSQLGL